VPPELVTDSAISKTFDATKVYVCPTVKPFGKVVVDVALLAPIDCTVLKPPEFEVSAANVATPLAKVLHESYGEPGASGSKPSAFRLKPM
jgi:hypothetical protein